MQAHVSPSPVSPLRAPTPKPLLVWANGTPLTQPSYCRRTGTAGVWSAASLAPSIVGVSPVSRLSPLRPTSAGASPGARLSSSFRGLGGLWPNSIYLGPWCLGCAARTLTEAGHSQVHAAPEKGLGSCVQALRASRWQSAEGIFLEGGRWCLVPCKSGQGTPALPNAGRTAKRGQNRVSSLAPLQGSCPTHRLKWRCSAQSPDTWRK